MCHWTWTRNFKCLSTTFCLTKNVVVSLLSLWLFLCLKW